MSKKILKRSLALGALMAFVITGQAWAAVTEPISTVKLKNANEASALGIGEQINVTEDVNITSTVLAGAKKYYAAISAIGGEANKVSVTGENIVVNLTDNDKQNIYAVAARGQSAAKQGGGIIELGGANTKLIDIDINAKASGEAVGLEAVGSTNHYAGATLTVTADVLDVNVVNTDSSGRAVGLSVLNRSTNIGEDYKPTKLIINAKDTFVTAQYGILAFSGGQLTVNGNFTVEASEAAIVTRGNAKTVINERGDGIVNINGDIVYSQSTGTLDADVFVNLVGDKSVFEGNVLVDGGTKDEITGMKVALSEGATWKLSEASVVNQATFGKDTVLELKDGSVFEALKDTEGNVTTGGVYALNAGGGNANKLTIVDGAKLTVKGIDYNTYNIAKGFDTISENKWQVTDLNTLMEGKWLQDEDNNLQLQVVAKDAGTLSDEMGVSKTTAGVLNDIVTAANASDAPQTGAAQNVIDFANALSGVAPEVAGQAVEAVVKMAEAGGNSATAASIVKNVTGVTNDRLSFNCGHSAPHKGGHGVGLFEEGSGADVWVEYVHGKDEVEDMPSTAGASSYEGQYNGIVMGVDFKKVGKFQSGVAFNYGEGDTNSVGTSARTHSDYDFWGIGYYGNIHNDDSNVIFDINYAKSDSDVTNYNIAGNYEASPETTTWTAGVKLEKLYQNENVQIVPYTGLRYMSIDPDDYKTKCGTYSYSMDRQDIWLLPLGVSIRQEIVNDNGWTVSPRVDLSYIWAFGDTDSNMEFATALNTKTNIGYDVMDDGSFLGLVGIEAHKGQWGYGIAYSYQKGDHSESKKWYVDVNYSF